MAIVCYDNVGTVVWNGGLRRVKWCGTEVSSTVGSVEVVRQWELCLVDSFTGVGEDRFY